MIIGGNCIWIGVDDAVVRPGEEDIFWAKEDKCEKTIKMRAYICVEEEYLVTALVPSDTACLANSPGKISLTAV